MNQYQPVIGLEIHVELKTQAKMFCRCPADYFGKPANSQTCPVCLGLPGALPVPNKKAIEYTHLIGRALNCHLNEVSKFDRKHYFYPDLPKGYQISQYDEPFASRGRSNIKDQKSNIKNIKIRRVHLEEDTGKLIHKDNQTLIDFNRSGVPLVEIVTEPDFSASNEVKIFLERLQTLIRDLEVSDADMEKGTMRMEPNISVRLMNYDLRFKNQEKELPKYKVEVKNINSFRFVKRAIDYELKRQREILERGERPIQETRGFEENKGTTYSQRTKEEAHDYRYFPEPDIPIMRFDQDYFQTIDAVFQSKSTLDKRQRLLIQEYKIGDKDALAIAIDKMKFEFFEACIKSAGQEMAASTAKVMINKPHLMQNVSPADFAQTVKKMYTVKTTDEGRLTEAIKQTMNSNLKAVEDYKKGRQGVLMFLVGQVMKTMKGQANAQVIMSKIKSMI